MTQQQVIVRSTLPDKNYVLKCNFLYGYNMRLVLPMLHNSVVNINTNTFEEI